MRQTPYGIGVNVGTKVIVPAGVYNVRIDDARDVAQNDVHVDPGQAVVLNLTPGQ